jgi:ribonucleoside-diphosphate reductase alpha chain
MGSDAVSEFQVIEPGSISEAIWEEKYRLKGRDGKPIDETVHDTFRRVAKAVAAAEDLEVRPLWEGKFLNAMSNFEFLPAGRILAGAGTDRDVSLFNCFVMGTIPDSIDGIYNSVREAALTMKTGGGVGMDFSTLRPRGAAVNSLGTGSSGAVSFMNAWDAMCETIMSAGNRRGAMMFTLRCDHPDIEEFIEAKREGKRLKNANLSVLVTDEFMDAVRRDVPWQYYFAGKPCPSAASGGARRLWQKIMRSTYDFADPGVIFIDRINDKNPLRDIEEIAATNPCGEEPLPPYGACLLGSINLARLVHHPFTPDAGIYGDRLDELVHVAVRFLDNVIDVSRYPLPAQREEALAKRRIGLGITGLADALIMLGLKYDSDDARRMAGRLTEHIADQAVRTSQGLAREKGHYPLWMPEQGPERRNSHLTSIAPTGTISLFAGNVSSGCEPVFDFIAKRNVRQPDGSFKAVAVKDYAERMANHVADVVYSKETWVTTASLSPEAHLKMVAALQPHVDSGISKTINLPESISFEDFQDIYRQAYDAGLKGCTTYRPNDITGSILSSDTMKVAREELFTQGSGPGGFTDGPDVKVERVEFYATEEERKAYVEALDKYPPGDVSYGAHSLKPGDTVRAKWPGGEAHQEDRTITQVYPPLKRPDELPGKVYKIKPPGAEHALYVTITDIVDNGRKRPFEIFFNSKNIDGYAWTVALSRMISAVFRKGGDIEFVAEELKAVFDPRGGFWMGKKHVPSLCAAVGDILEKHMADLAQSVERRPSKPEVAGSSPAVRSISPEPHSVGAAAVRHCPQCQRGVLTKRENCDVCDSCTYTKC